MIQTSRLSALGGRRRRVTRQLDRQTLTIHDGSAWLPSPDHARRRIGRPLAVAALRGGDRDPRWISLSSSRPAVVSRDCMQTDGIKEEEEDEKKEFYDVYENYTLREKLIYLLKRNSPSRIKRSCFLGNPKPLSFFSTNFSSTKRKISQERKSSRRNLISCRDFLHQLTR